MINNYYIKSKIDANLFFDQGDVIKFYFDDPGLNKIGYKLVVGKDIRIDKYRSIRADNFFFKLLWY